jgi:hypothetical protein
MQQLVSKDSGKEFLQELFEKKHVCNIIPQCPRSRTKAMMKRKGKAPIEKQVEKFIKKKTMSKMNETWKML